MANFASLTAKLKLDIQDFARNINRAAEKANTLSANLKGQINNGLTKPAKEAKVEFKDVARIVQGIVISKVFYSGLNAIRNCKNAVYEFSQSLEYAKVAYSNLFGDTALAEEFINVLKDFAATTPFSFSESEQAAKRLLAYGIQYKNVMYVMQGVLAASSMQNNPQVIESVSRALGQIYTKGRLMGEEVRQLAEAGIPAYEILQEKLGLTSAQMQNLGRQTIPASEAINALVDGMNERFGDVITASSRTFQGLLSNLKDNAVMLASGIFEPLFTTMKSILNVVGTFVARMRQLFELKGLGGVFEAIFPPELHDTVRQFVASIMVLFQAVMRLVSSLRGLLAPAMEAIVRVFNAFAPIISTVANALSVIVGWVTNNATAMKWLTTALAAAATMWVVFKVRALASAAVTGVITAISKALAVLSTMLSFVLAHPFWALLIGLAGVVVGLSGGFGKLSNSISSFYKKLTSFNGVDPDKVLLPSQKERANDLNKFNKALDGTKDSMDDLADSTGKATKAAKGLLSFDEVFKLNQPDEGTGNGIQTPSDFDIPDLSGIDAGGFLPEIPSFEGFAENFVTKLVDSLKKKLIGAGLGAVLGGILGGILGGPLGAKIGAIAGAIAGWFWDDIAKALRLNDTQKITVPILTGLGAIAGALLGGPVGALIGGVAGALASLFWGEIADKLSLTDAGKVAIPLTTGIGAAIGAVAGGPLGAGIGAGIGALVGWLSDCIVQGIEEHDWSNIGYPIGIGLGAGIGALIGGPAGAAIGAGIGALVAWLYDQIYTGITSGGWDFSKLGLAIGGGLGAAIGGIMGGPVGLVIGAAVGALAGWLTGLLADCMDSIADAWSTGIEVIGDWFRNFADAWSTGMSSITGSIKSFFSNFAAAWSTGMSSIAGSIKGFFSNFADAWSTGMSSITGSIKGFFSGIISTITNGLNKILGDIKKCLTYSINTLLEAGSSMKEYIGTFLSNVVDNISVGLSSIFNSVKDCLSYSKDTLVEAGSSMKEYISTGVSNIVHKIGTGLSNILTSIKDCLSYSKDTLVDAGSSMAEYISTWFANAWSTLTSWLESALSNIVNWLNSVWQAFVSALTNILNAVSQKFTEIIGIIRSKLSDAASAVTTWFSNMLGTVQEKVSSMASAVSTWFSNIYTTIDGKVSSAYDAVKNFFSSMLDSIKSSMSSMLTAVKNTINDIYNALITWVSNLWDNVFGKVSNWIDNGVAKLKDFIGLNDKASKSAATTTSGPSVANTSAYIAASYAGHAKGGVFNREHVARFAEGNKTEAIIPLEDATAMQPFVDAVSNGITASMMPLIANISSPQSSLQPLYVGTLVADERGLKELARKMNVINLQESARRG